MLVSQHPPRVCVEVMLRSLRSERSALIRAQNSLARASTPHRCLRIKVAPKDVPLTPWGDAGTVSELGTAKGTIHHLVFLLSGSRLPPLPPAYTHALARMHLLSLELAGACREGKGEAGFARPGTLGEDAVSVAPCRAVGLITAGSILSFPYFGSRAIPARCSDLESRFWGSSLNRAAAWT